MLQVSSKLQHIRIKLKLWNKEVFHNITKRKEIIKNEISHIELTYQINGRSSEIAEKKKSLKSDFHDIRAQEETHWRQKFVFLG